MTDTQTSKLVEMSWDPITRIVGSLGIHTKIDFEQKKVVECHSTSSIFRGYSIFMKGKDPRDAHFITSRICGICGDNHATCANYAQNMAFGVRPPHIAEWIVNLGEAAPSVVLDGGFRIGLAADDAGGGQKAVGLRLSVTKPVTLVDDDLTISLETDARWIHAPGGPLPDGIVIDVVRTGPAAGQIAMAGNGLLYSPLPLSELPDAPDTMVELPAGTNVSDGILTPEQQEWVDTVWLPLFG